jgi:phosphate transport system substrate-binding protein
MNKIDYGKDTQKMAGNEQIAEAVAGDVNGIGYVGLAYADRDGIAPATVDGIAPAPENQASYALSRNLYYYSVGEPTGEAKKFITWSLTSPAAAAVINKVGFIAPKVEKK